MNRNYLKRYVKNQGKLMIWIFVHCVCMTSIILLIYHYSRLRGHDSFSIIVRVTKYTKVPVTRLQGGYLASLYQTHTPILQKDDIDDAWRKDFMKRGKGLGRDDTHNDTHIYNSLGPTHIQQVCSIICVCVCVCLLASVFCNV